MYACPEGLDPRGATVIEKRLAREANLRPAGPAAPVHPMYDYRKVPAQKLKQRLDVLKFADEGPLTDLGLDPASVRIPLDQHAGAAAQPVVRTGQSVKKYDLIAKAAGKISSNIHASIAGTVMEIAAEAIHIARG
jgi:biotin carboxyl carrier protein